MDKDAIIERLLEIYWKAVDIPTESWYAEQLKQMALIAIFEFKTDIQKSNLSKHEQFGRNMRNA